MTTIQILLLIALLLFAFTGFIAMICILIAFIAVKNGATLVFKYEEDNN